jgi:peptidyl-prolyl cis-trans isomerase C
MKKKILFLVLYCFTSLTYADLVSDSSNNKINKLDLDLLLESAPNNAQIALLKNKKHLKVQLEQLYLKKVLAEMAKNDGLDKQEMNAARLQSIVNNALFLLKLDALKKSNKKDYSKYARQLYDVNKSKYKVGERVDASHILFSTKKLSDTEALKNAQKIRKILQEGADFSQVAVKESNDKSVKYNKGNLGLFEKGKMVKPFEEVVFVMQKGEISKPVKTKYGYHLIKLNNKTPAGIKPFEEVKDSIINKLREDDWEQKRVDFYAQVKKDNAMKIDEQILDNYIENKLIELKAM